MHIHLDAVGGIAGDMFAAALLDTWPELTELVIATIRQAGLGEEVALQHLQYNDGVLSGSKFCVTLQVTDGSGGNEVRHNDGDQQHLALDDQSSAHEPHPHHHHDEGQGHHPLHHHVHQHPEHQHPEHQHPGHQHVNDHHRHHTDEQSAHPNEHGHHQWSALKSHLANSAMPDGVKRHTLGIFTELAIAEASVHGVDVGTVTFHEVGNWDSVADIVAAATLIDALAVQSWSVSALPIGRGLVKTAHGELPVPAPATSLLLDGFAFRDDGRPGERVTPTGAAILKYLSPASGIGQNARTLYKSGFGFGNRKLPGMSNVLRVMAFESATGNAENDSAGTDSTGTTDTVGVIQFEIDDQSGEELAATLEHLRASNNVIDATQSTVFGKKGRMMAAIQILTRPHAIESVAQLCFRQSSTLGLRTRIEHRHILHRRDVTIDNMHVKLAQRPGGTTAKAEMNDVQHDTRGHHARRYNRQQVEGKAEAQAAATAEANDSAKTGVSNATTEE